MKTMQCLDQNGRKTRRTPRENKSLRIAIASAADRELIYRLRHEVYARELQQHQPNVTARLMDELDAFNHYLCAWTGERLAGFISITPPGHASYSLDKYLSRDRLPFPVDAGLYEVRVLTVNAPARGRETAAVLMYAALRWVEARGGRRIAAIGRREVLGLYEKAGLRRTGLEVSCGAVTFEVLHATTEELRAGLGRFQALLRRLEQRTDWQLGIAFQRPAPCFHGGTFFRAIGERFDHLERRDDVINADVLDAWYPPAPGVLAALQENLAWLLRTSPPTDGGGLVETIARCRGVRPEQLLLGAGSSDLIFRALPAWLKRSSKVLLLDPTYGEYAHLLERVIDCDVHRLPLSRDESYAVSLGQLSTELARGFDLAVLVNPNSPTGQHVPCEQLAEVLRGAPRATRIWVDETYVEYAGPGQSLEAFAARSENVLVCKSMSKVYALSGLRVAYLCAAPHQLEALRALTPPWVVGLPAQVAAVRALEDPEYYARRRDETHPLRLALGEALTQLNWAVIPGCANFLLTHLPADGLTAAEVVAAAEPHGLFLRNAGLTSARLGDRAIRLAVKDAETNRRMMEILRKILGRPR